jgi:hypothetical protein
MLAAASRRRTGGLFLWAILALIVTTPTASATAIISDADCRAQGFDPWQLACSTCDELALFFTKKGNEGSSATATSAAKKNNENIIHVCRQCCQAYKDTPRIQKPYAAAVLLHPPIGSRPAGSTTTEDELTQFLTQDWDSVVATKSAARLIKIEHSSPALDNAMDMYQRMMMLQMRPPAQVCFFESPLPTKASARSALLNNPESLQAAASEVIVLDASWKKDDIKDMLMTLLMQ